MNFYERQAASGFSPPASLQDGERQRLELVATLESINGQLGFTEKLAPDGQRFTFEEFRDWRGRCIAAKRHTEAQLRAMKVWIKEQRRARSAAEVRSSGYDVRNPLSLLGGARVALKRLVVAGLLTSDEQNLLDGINEFLEQGVVPSAEHPVGCECQTCLLGSRP